MILQALTDYYESRSQDRDSDMPLAGFSREKISFVLNLDPDGKLTGVTDLRQQEGKKLAPRQLPVPEAVKRASNIAANFLWDNTGYVLGADDKGKPERTAKTFEAFKALCHAIGDGLDDTGMAAVLRFLDDWDPAKAADLPQWADMVKGANLVFRLEDGSQAFVHDRPVVKAAWLDYRAGAAGERRGMCLVTGRDAPIARLHPSIKGVRGAQPSGASLVSFNQESFTSYGKDQSYNAPVGEPAAFAYTTALNSLLRKGSKQRVQIGDASTVFWTDRPSKAEELVGEFFDPSADQGSLIDLRQTLESVRDGKMPVDDPEEFGNGFYILGLAPNASRLSVRFWHQDTVGGMYTALLRHFDDLALERTWENDPEFPGMWRLLRETAAQGDSENVNPALAGAFMRAILTEAPYPTSLPATVITRIRADQTVNYLRTAMLKAYLVRNTRKEVPVNLDPNNTNIGYLLGRLFAVLEKAQQDAIEGINTTIKDRFYGAASATPRSVFPRLLHMAQHHIAKSDYGYVSDILLAKITERMTAEQGFPAHLSLDDQSMFALGYYHQRNDNYRPNDQKIDPVKEKK